MKSIGSKSEVLTFTEYEFIKGEWVHVALPKGIFGQKYFKKSV